MIWIGLIVLSTGVCGFLVWPLLRPVATVDSNSEREAYLNEIAVLDARPSLSDTLTTRKLELERRVLALQSNPSTAPSKPAFALASVLCLIICAGSALIYTRIGSPDLSAFAPVAQPQPPSLPDMAQQLKARLDAQPDQPQGWQIYGRTLMSLEEYPGAIRAYETALKLSPEDENLRDELDSARTFIAQKQAASQMSAAEKNEMIDGMVSGLAARLHNAPDDPEGWARLLRARLVLGQLEQGAREAARLREIYAGDPERIEQILQQSGWATAQ